MLFLSTRLKRAFIFVLFAVLAVVNSSWAQLFPTKLLIFPTTVDTTTADSLVTADSLRTIQSTLDSLLTIEFSSSDSFNVISFDSVANDTNVNISDFEKETQLETVFSEIKSHWGVEVGILSNLKKTNNFLSLHIKGIELSSGIVIHRSYSEFIVADSTQLEFPNKVKPILSEIKKALVTKKTVFGYPFAENGCGVLIIKNQSCFDDSTAAAQTKLDSMAMDLRQEYQQNYPDHLYFKSLVIQPADSSTENTIDWQQIQDISLLLDAYLTLWECPDTTNMNLGLGFHFSAIFDTLQINTVPPLFPPFPDLVSFNLLQCKELGAQIIRKLSHGIILWRLGDITGAETYLIHADSLADSSGCRLAVTKFIASQFYHTKVRSEAELGKIDQPALDSADRHYSSCLTDLPSDSGLAAAWLHFNWADIRQKQGSWQDALAALEMARQLYKANDRPREAALMDMRTADVYTNQKKWDDVLVTCESALPSFTALGDCLAVSAALEKLAPIFELKNEPNKSLAVYERNAKLNTELQRHYEAARIYGQMGLLLRNECDYDGACGYLLEELSIAKRLQSEPALAKSYFHLGIVYHAMDSTDAAIEHFEQAYRTMDMLGDTLGMARAMNNIGAVFHQNGDAQKALSCYQTALDLSEKFGDGDNQIRSHSNIANIFTDQEEWEQANQHYDQAISLAESSGNTRRVVMVTYSKGLSYVKQGRLKAGYEEIKKAIEMGGGTVHGNPEKEEAFLRRLETLIDEIEELW